MQLDTAKLRALTDRYPYSGQGVSSSWLDDWMASFAHYYQVAAAGVPASPQGTSVVEEVPAAAGDLPSPPPPPPVKKRAPKLRAPARDEEQNPLPLSDTVQNPSPAQQDPSEPTDTVYQFQ